MDSYISKCNTLFKLIACCSLLFWALLFASPASAASREVNPSLNVTPVQLAYWGRYHHHRHWRGYGWHRGHYRHWHHWRRW